MKKTFNKNISFFVLLILTISACYEPSEGCLDSYYANYNVSADKPCDDCCSLPQFNLYFLYKVDSVALDTLYYKNNLGLDYRVADFFLLFNDFNINGQLDNYQIVNEDGLGMTRFDEKNSNIGGIMIKDSIEGIDFKLGIPESIDNTNSAAYLDYPELEYLDEKEEYLSDGSFYLAGLDFVMDSISNDTLRYRFEDFNMEDVELSFTLDNAFINKGAGLTVTLELDFNILFQDVNVEDTNDQDLFKQKMSKNFKLALGSN